MRGTDSCYFSSCCKGPVNYIRPHLAEPFSVRQADGRVKHCAGLTSLDLSYCAGLTNEAMVAMAVHCTGLTYLDLRGSRKITDFAVAEHFKGITSVRSPSEGNPEYGW